MKQGPRKQPKFSKVQRLLGLERQSTAADIETDLGQPCFRFEVTRAMSLMVSSLIVLKLAELLCTAFEIGRPNSGISCRALKVGSFSAPAG